MLKAYIEIHVEPGSDVDRIVENIRRSEGVKEACRVVGRADVLVAVEGRDLRHVSDIALQKIAAVRGVTIGHTLVCVDSEILPKPTTTVPPTMEQEIPTISFS
ncbi:MAG: Lrp/AsnC ligand binding domain-containing protein [Nitrososphaerales archaeon]